MRSISVDTSLVKSCTKCGTGTGPFNRHHKGFDSMLGIYNKGIRLNYGLYNDCVLLCVACHCTIHYIYEDYTERWTNRTSEGAKRFRKILIKVCDDWLSGKIKTPKVPKRYLRNFMEGYEEWLTSQGKSATGLPAT